MYFPQSLCLVARAKQKKVFYNRRYKLPPWGQPYVLWAIAAVINLGVLFFTSVESVPTEPAPSLSSRSNGFAENAFYELRDAEAGSELESAISLAKRLERKHGFKIREDKIGNCKLIRITRGSEPRQNIAALLDGEKSQSIFMLLTFLDRIAVQSPQAAIEGLIYRVNKACPAANAPQANLMLDQNDDQTTYDKIFHMKNLRLRRHFESAFLMTERTLWANVLSLIATDNNEALTLSVKSTWSGSAEAMLAQNPLLRHPVAAKEAAAMPEVGLYLGSHTQLTKAGLTTLLVLLALLALIPFANALGTFRERLDISSALTSGVLYAAAFFVYFLILKLITHFAKSDFALPIFLLILIPIVFVPVRILQRTLLRAQPNRAGLHALVYVLLVCGLFVSPLLSAGGMIALISVSAFFRATPSRKVIRILFVGILLAVFFFATRAPLGSFSNFFNVLLPAFTSGDVLKIILLCLVGGNLIALLFVPPERV